MGRSTPGVSKMPLLDFIRLVVSCTAGAVFVADANAHTKEIYDKQNSRFIRREPTAGSFAEIVYEPLPLDAELEFAKQTSMAAARQKVAAQRIQKHIEQEKSKSTEKEHRKAATVSGLPDIAFASDAWVVTDKEEHHANLLRIILERKKATGGSESSSDYDMCDKDFPLGHWNTSTCSSDGATRHELIEMEEMCEYAASQANATAGDGALNYFRIPDEWGDFHPKGCFVFPCHWDPGQVCYWFNSQEDMPRYPWGAPVCQRPMYMNGTEDTNSGCPEGYDVIMDDFNCSVAGICMGYGLEENNIVGVSFPLKNASQHDLYPEGCFIHKERGHSFFNPKYGQNPPQHPRGIPLCNVTQITHFPEISLPWDVFW